MKRRADQAIGISSAAAVAVISPVLMVTLNSTGGFSGGSTGGPVIPVAGEPGPGPGLAPALPGPVPRAPSGWAEPYGAGKKPLEPLPGAKLPVDTGGSRVYLRLTNRGIYWINGDSAFVSEIAHIVRKPFSLDETIVSKSTKAKKTSTSSARITVIGNVQSTSTDGGRTWKRKTLSGAEYTMLVMSSDPKQITRFARSLPGVSTKPGVQVGKFSAKPGPLGLSTSSMNFTLGAARQYLPPTLGDELTKFIPEMEGISGYLVADKYDRAQAFGASDIALPFAMCSIGVLYGGYQS